VSPFRKTAFKKCHLINNFTRFFTFYEIFYFLRDFLLFTRFLGETDLNWNQLKCDPLQPSLNAPELFPVNFKLLFYW